MTYQIGRKLGSIAMRRNKLCPVPECEMQTKEENFRFGWNIMRKSGPQKLEMMAAFMSYSHMAMIKI